MTQTRVTRNVTLASQKANWRYRMPSSSWIYVYLISMGWTNAEPEHSADNSRFSAFNSRLGRHQFPFRAATGINSQGIDMPYCFQSQTTVAPAKSTKFPVSTGKPGICPTPEPEVVRP